MSFESEPLFPRPTGEIRHYPNSEEVLVEAAFTLPPERVIRTQGQLVLFYLDPDTRTYRTPGEELL